MRGDDIEAVNDELVAARRDRTPTEVSPNTEGGAGFRRGGADHGAPCWAAGDTAGRTRPLPGPLLPSALVFDHHTHLRYDMAPRWAISVGDIDAREQDGCGAGSG